MYISEINIYPIKSLKGISVDSATVEERGLQYDRRWMLTTPDGMFFTQREFPTMARISTWIENGGVGVAADGFGEAFIPFLTETGKKQEVTIWQSVCEGEICSPVLKEWFSDVLGTNCQLVYMPDYSRRNVNPLFIKNDDVVSFADGYPLMVLSEASLAELNTRLDEPLPMNRFRPNLVVSGPDAFAEDDWRRIRIGHAVFRTTKPSERCVITTIDQAKGVKTGKEPLKTLASFRMAKDVMPDRCASLGVNDTAVLFGQNLIAENPGGVIRIDDEIEILDVKS